MSERELLEMAARAAGVEGGWGPVFKIGDDEVDVSDIWFLDAPETGSIWDPLTDDGDALRLAVLLSLRVEPYTGVKIHYRYPVANITDVYSLHSHDVKLSELHGLDPAAATRRAIVRAAAEIGRAMP